MLQKNFKLWWKHKRPWSQKMGSQNSSIKGFFHENNTSAASKHTLPTPQYADQA